MSFALKINDQFIHFSEVIEPTFDLLNPMFNTTGSHILSIEIPVNSHNNLIFGYPSDEHLPNNKLDSFECEIFISNTFFANGLLNIDSASKSSFSGSIGLDTGSFWFRIKDKLMSELKLGGVRNLGADYLDVEDYFDLAANSGYPEYDFVAFPIEDYAFYNGTTFLSVYDDVNAVNYYDTLPATENKFGLLQNTLVPYPYVCYLIDAILNEHGYKLERNDFFEDQELRTLVSYNNYSICKFNFFPLPSPVNIFFINQSFPCTITTNGAHGFTLGQQGVSLTGIVGMTELNQDIPYSANVISIDEIELNNIDSSTFNAYVSGGTVERGAFRMQPNTDIKLSDNMKKGLKISEFLNTLEEFWNFTLFVNDSNKTAKFIKNETILNNHETIDITDKWDGSFKKQYSKFSGIDFKDTPDSGDSYFTENVSNIDNLVEKGAVNIYADLPYTGDVEIGDTRKVRFEFAHYKFVNDSLYPVGTWVFQTKSFFDIQTGSSPIDTIETGASSLVMYRGIDNSTANTRHWLIPKSEQEGNNNEVADLDNEAFETRFLFYRGFQPDSTGALYPLGSSDIYDYDFTQIGNYTLALEGDNGRFKNFFEKWAYWFINKKFEAETIVNFSVADLLDFDFSQKYRLNNKNYLIKGIRFKELKDSTKILKVDIIPIS